MPRIESRRFPRFSKNGRFGNPGILHGDRDLRPPFSDPRIPSVRGHPEDLAGWYRQMELLSPSKKPAGILVHQSPLQPRLYLISPCPVIVGVIILKNAEPDRSEDKIPDGNGRGHKQQRYSNQKLEGMGDGIWACTGRGNLVTPLPGIQRTPGNSPSHFLYISGKISKKNWPGRFFPGNPARELIPKISTRKSKPE